MEELDDEAQESHKNRADDNFNMYYALGPTTATNTEDEEMQEPVIDNDQNNSHQTNHDSPDLVHKQSKLKRPDIITQEPRKLTAPSFDNRDNLVDDDRDYTSMQRQMDAYKNLEDLLDVPWEESDLSPPSKVDVVLRVGGEIGEKYNNV